jgi:glycosyltransferase involved in cell wall biosynthesis
MVQLMLAGFGGDRRHRRSSSPADPAAGAPPARTDSFGIQCYHVNARLSQKLEDIGDLRIGKFVLLLGYCLQAVWCRFRYGVDTLYYIPAPGKKSALYRDWMVMLVCRRVFKHVILHWHAAGLAKWMETVLQIRARAFTYQMMKKADLSIVLSNYNRADAEKIFSRQIKIVGNGIPDPCPRFAEEVLPRRKARFAARQKLLAGVKLEPEDLKDAGADSQIVSVLYLAHCTREKGLFDAVAAVILANQRLAAEKSPLSLRLVVTGTFVNADDKAEFEQLSAQPAAAGAVRYLGFVSGDQKDQLLRNSDLFCFPTYYQNENQPVNLIEAMGFGLPILTSRWRSIPELFPANYAGLVDVRSPEQIADSILKLIKMETGEGFRDIFLRDFTLERYLAGLAEAFHHVTDAGKGEAPAGIPQGLRP